MSHAGNVAQVQFHRVLAFFDADSEPSCGIKTSPLATFIRRFLSTLSSASMASLCLSSATWILFPEPRAEL
jgi:hypothetical protein